MAKGQKRSTKEIRKPKQAKAPAAAKETAFSETTKRLDIAKSR